MLDNTTRANMNHPSHSHDYINFKQWKKLIKKSHIGIRWKTELIINNLQNVQNLKAHNLKIDIVKAKNAEITNYGIMHIFN